MKSRPTTRPTAHRCLMTWSSRSTGYTRRARRWASRSSRWRATRPTMCSERSRRGRRLRAIGVAIVSIDKDFFQLVRDGAISVYDPREDGAWFDEQGVLEKFGVKPSQVVDVLALVGDTSDNVAGVPGIGKKGAIDLITQYGSLDGLLAHTAELKPKQREALDASRTGAAEPPAGDHSHRCADRLRSGIAALSRRVARALLRALHAPGLQDAGQRLRAHRRLRPDRLRAGHHGAELDSLVADLRAAGELRDLPDHRSALAMRSTIVGIAVSTQDRQGRYIPIGHRGEEEQRRSTGERGRAGAARRGPRARVPSSRCSKTKPSPSAATT